MKKKGENKKVPFNAFRKPLVSAILGATLVVGSMGLLTACSGEAGKSAYDLAVENGFEGTVQEWLDSLKGDQGNAGAAGQTPTIEIDPDTKNWIINGIDTGVKAEGVDGIDGNDGATGQDGQAGQDGQDGQDGHDGAKGDKGDTGNGIESVDVKYEYDDNGNVWAVFTITYTEGEPQQIRTKMPKKVTGFTGIVVGTSESYHSDIKFAKVANADDALDLCVGICYEGGGEVDIIKVTDDMYVEDEFHHKPDFTTVGQQEVRIKYKGLDEIYTIEVVDVATLGTPARVDFIDQTYRVGTVVNDMYVELVYGDEQNDPDNVIRVVATLSLVAEDAAAIDTSKVANFEVALKADYVVGDFDSLYLVLYNPEVCNIQYISVDTGSGPLTFDMGDATYQDILNNLDAEVWLYEADEDGNQYYDVKFSDLTVDYSKFDINKVGDQMIPVSYALEGQTAYQSYVWVSVEADMSEATLIDTYYIDNQDELMMMFSEMNGSYVELYDNGVALISGSYQASYDEKALDDGLLKIYDSLLNDYAYYKLDSNTNKINFYQEQTVPTGYSMTVELMGEIFNAQLYVYGETGTCKAMVSIEVEPGTELYIPYAVVDVTWEDENTLSAIGNEYVIGEDLIAIEPPVAE